MNEITTQRQENGSVLVQTRDDRGDLIKCVYYGYTTKQAKEKFTHEYLK